jgi:hypothetical protein
VSNTILTPWGLVAVVSTAAGSRRIPDRIVAHHLPRATAS